MPVYNYLQGKRRAPGISANLLKLFAMLAMTADSFAVVVIKNGKLYGYSEEYYAMALATEEGQRWFALYRILRLIGTLAFPLFCFLLAEGVEHTSDVRRYLFRVTFLAFVSELPFDLCVFNATYDFGRQNPCFTLAAALWALAGMKRFKRRTEVKWLCVILGCAAAYLMRSDFGAPAVLMTALLYNFRNEKKLQIASGVVISAFQSLAHFGSGALAFIPVWFYSGEKGRFRFGIFAYLFYPLQLMIFYAMIYVGAML